MARVACLAGVVGVGILALGEPAPAQGRPSVLVVTVDGTITPVMARHLDDAVDRAEREGHEGLVVRLDTPGGLDTAMRDMVQDLLNADVPTVVWVAPSGARAASAGALITLASHVAAMAPGTNVGASTPIDLGGGEVGDKVVNDDAAYAAAIAELRGRDTDFARQAVRRGESITENEALERNVIDVVARDLDDLLEQLDGRTVTVGDGREITLRTAGAAVEEHELGFFRSLQQWLADPNIAFLFLSIGTLAIIYELANPGVGAGGIVGVILLILAFFSLSVLPVNVVGAALLVLALALFVTEMFVPGIGVFGAGGVVALALGGVFLFEGSVSVDPWVLWPTALAAGGAALVIARFAWRSRRAPHASGAEALVGQTALVRTASGGTPQVFVEGALWRARPGEGQTLEIGQSVRIVGRDGLDLLVDPLAPPTGYDKTDERLEEQ